MYSFNTEPVRFIRVTSGSMQGKTLALKPDVSVYVGREKACDLVLSMDYVNVSRMHCSIKFDSVSKMFTVMDLSSNGTYVNGIHKLEKNVNTPVVIGSVLELGDNSCTVLLG